MKPHNQPVTVDAIGEYNYLNDAAARYAVDAKFSLGEFVRWLLQERQDRIRDLIRLHERLPPRRIVDPDADKKGKENE
jgi:hypothetical protein